MTRPVLVASQRQLDGYASHLGGAANRQDQLLIQPGLKGAIGGLGVVSDGIDETHQTTRHTDLVVVPLCTVPLKLGPERVIPNDKRRGGVASMGDHRDQGAAITAFPAALDGEETRPLASRRKERELLLHVQAGPMVMPMPFSARKRLLRHQRSADHTHIGPVEVPKFPPRTRSCNALDLAART